MIQSISSWQAACRKTRNNQLFSGEKNSSKRHSLKRIIPLIIPINLPDSLAVSLQHPTPLTKLAKRSLSVMKCEMF